MWKAKYFYFCLPFQRTFPSFNEKAKQPIKMGIIYKAMFMQYSFIVRKILFQTLI